MQLLMENSRDPRSESHLSERLQHQIPDEAHVWLGMDILDIEPG